MKCFFDIFVKFGSLKALAENYIKIDIRMKQNDAKKRIAIAAAFRKVKQLTILTAFEKTCHI